MSSPARLEASLVTVGAQPGSAGYHFFGTQRWRFRRAVGGCFGLESFQDPFSPGHSRKVSGLSYPRLSPIHSLSLIRFANEFLQPLTRIASVQVNGPVGSAAKLLRTAEEPD